MDTLDRHLACQICFENYRHSGEHVPRLLPCTHTVCETCVGQLLFGENLTCPECRVKHKAENGVKSFPQNKYILMNVKRKNSARKVKVNFEKCKSHGLDLILFCCDSKCEKSICVSCLTKDHVGHKVVDLDEGQKAVLTQKIESLRNALLLKKHQILKTKSEVETKNTASLEALKEQKEYIMKILNEKFEEFSKKFNEKSEECTSTVTRDLDALDESLLLLENITENTDKANLVAKNMSTELDTVKDVEIQLKAQLSAIKSYNYFEYQNNDDDIKETLTNAFGNFSDKDIEIEDMDATDLKLVDQPKMEVRDKREHASEYTCEGTHSIQTTRGAIYGLCLIGNTAMVYRGGNELTQYKLSDGGESRTSQLSDQPNGIAPVTLAGKFCLALSYKNKNKIEFRDATNLTRIIHSYSVAPHQPWTICSSAPFDATSSTAHSALSPCNLLFEDTSINPSTIRWLDCDFSPPKPMVENDPILTDQYFLKDICVAKDGDKELLISSSYTNTIQAYNTSNLKLEWSVSGKLENEAEEKEFHPNGVTTDGRGHLFVCDTNNKCIQMFHVIGGRYMGRLVKQGQHGMGEPQCIKWCKKTSSLVVVHAKKKYNHISVIKVT